MLVNVQLLLAVALKIPYKDGKPRDSENCEKRFQSTLLVQCPCQFGNVTCAV